MVASLLVRFLVGQNALGRTRFARRRIIVMNERWIPVLAAEWVSSAVWEGLSLAVPWRTRA
jgi:hypothetical protein